MIREVLRLVLQFLFRVLTRVEVAGLQNIPKTGGCIVAMNHLSRLDAPLVFSFLTRKDSTGLIADKYKHHPLFRWIVEGAWGIWLDRDNPDYGALRAAVRYLRAGGVLGIAPEGTRSQTGSLMASKPGVAFLATKANVPIVPAAIVGTEVTMRELVRLRRSPVRLEFGVQFLLLEGNTKNREVALQQAADEIMCQIACLLPPSYRGVYAEHPRVLELLQMNGKLEAER